ncbi:hypothetical protein MNBD_GAMMA11-908 [hydrothermal vent metagenome]|uniref:Uncharacterized protein n=1 Tax=hydrothermal vent metagenome TaxID=652676 RepID=A0A3B0XDJ7_9ZZZZ
MIRICQIVALCSLFNAPYAHATDAEKNDNGYITRQNALGCIQSSTELAGERQQLRVVEADKLHLNSKIIYLQNEIEKRRRLIESLDKHPTQLNNENYNQLVTQFEALREEHRETIQLFEEKQNQFINQHSHFNELEHRHNAHCLDNIQVTRKLYLEVCEHDVSNWCKAFYF